MLALPIVTDATVAARHRLGRGVCLPFEVAGRRGEVRLEPGRMPVAVNTLCFETACGVLALAEAGPLFSLMGECPVTLAETGNDPESWFWAVFQHYLSPQLQAVLGAIRLLEAVRPVGFDCRISVTLGVSRVMGHMWLAPESFLALCDSGQWYAMAPPLPANFQMNVAVPLGCVRLPIAQVQGLRRGDLLVLEQAFFNAQGTGSVQVGRRRLRGCMDDETGRLCLTLIAIEETAVDEDFSIPDFSAHEEDRPIAEGFSPEPFDELSLALTVRCGVLNLTLGELRNLAPGAVLGVSGYAPGMAGLYYGDRLMGQGQLVDVDGRLGLQVSRVMFER